MENCVADGCIRRGRSQYPHSHVHPSSSEDVLQEVEERLLASPHIPEEWWILAPPTCPHFPVTCPPDAPEPYYLGDSCTAHCSADLDVPGCLDSLGVQNQNSNDNRECIQFHVDVDLHVAAANVEPGEACVSVGCECKPSSGSPATAAVAEDSDVSRPFGKVPLENLPDVVDNCSEREVCVEGVVGEEGKEAEADGEGGGSSDQQVGGGPSRGRGSRSKRRTVYV